MCLSKLEDVFKVQIINNSLDVEWITFNGFIHYEGYHSEWLRSNGEKLYIFESDDMFEPTVSCIHPGKALCNSMYEPRPSEWRAFIIGNSSHFINNNLTSWEIKYCIDNDTNRFSWADNEKGRGVIYYMKDEFNNECPYDFKNILFHTSECYYDEYPYTFHKFINGEFVYELSDFSLNEKCHSNIIKPYYDNGKQILNSIIFYNEYNPELEEEPVCYGNTFKVNCFNNFFRQNCFSNTFGEYCYNITMGSNCYRNTFRSEIYNCTIGHNFYLNVLGDKCYSNTFGNECQGNTFGQVCSLNTIGDGFSNNIFGNVCHSNTIGNAFTHNVLSNNCHHNTFGDNCSSNKFGTGCYSNVFGNYFQRNDMGSLCNGNKFEFNYMQYNTIGNGVRECTFTNSETAASGAQIQRYKIEGGIYKKTIPLLRTRSYATTVALNSSGTLKIYCEADLA